MLCIIGFLIGFVTVMIMMFLCTSAGSCIDRCGTCCSTFQDTCPCTCTRTCESKCTCRGSYCVYYPDGNDIINGEDVLNDDISIQGTDNPQELCLQGEEDMIGTANECIMDDLSRKEDIVDHSGDIENGVRNHSRNDESMINFERNEAIASRFEEEGVMNISKTTVEVHENRGMSENNTEEDEYFDADQNVSAKEAMQGVGYA